MPYASSEIRQIHPRVTFAKAISLMRLKQKLSNHVGFFTFGKFGSSLVESLVAISLLFCLTPCFVFIPRLPSVDKI